MSPVSMGRIEDSMCPVGRTTVGLRWDRPAKKKKTEAAVGVGGFREPVVGGGAELEPASESSHLGVQLFLRSGGRIFTHLLLRSGLKGEGTQRGIDTDLESALHDHIDSVPSRWSGVVVDHRLWKDLGVNVLQRACSSKKKTWPSRVRQLTE